MAARPTGLAVPQGGPPHGGDIAILLDGSELVESRRYAVYDGKAYCAREDRPDVWHGHPVG